MTEEELKEIEERCLSGTKGPWIPMIEGITHTCGDDFIMIGVKDADDYENLSRGNDLYLSDGNNEDLNFVANAKQDIPKLIAEIRKLKEKLNKVSC
ncbi:hypothetical protein [Formosa sp. Hel1_33_131]|jgi:hypothetical protein|uniref:hypothetical protein n=1 Tax=Formosa sp. Hel1_33_131 TaxID=1336794 RepID=UPI00084E2866|nr:hypothetical protein [Formosa sp. Hel1_33_131]